MGGREQAGNHAHCGRQAPPSGSPEVPVLRAENPNSNDPYRQPERGQGEGATSKASHPGCLSPHPLNIARHDTHSVQLVEVPIMTTDVLLLLSPGISVLATRAVYRLGKARVRMGSKKMVSFFATCELAEPRLTISPGSRLLSNPIEIRRQLERSPSFRVGRA